MHFLSFNHESKERDPIRFDPRYVCIFVYPITRFVQ